MIEIIGTLYEMEGVSKVSGFSNIILKTFSCGKWTLFINKILYFLA